MKNTNTCPKCSSNNIAKIPGGISSYGLATVIPINMLRGKANTTRYVCTDCGFFEWWVDKKEDLKNIAKKYLTKEI